MLMESSEVSTPSVLVPAEVIADFAMEFMKTITSRIRMRIRATMPMEPRTINFFMTAPIKGR